MCSQIIAFHTQQVARIALELTQVEAYHFTEKKKAGLSCHTYKDIMSIRFKYHCLKLLAYHC